jgi:hypothetical protein
MSVMAIHMDLLRHVLAVGTGETFKNVAAGVSSIATAGAILVGGVWAYFNFAKGRTYKPRLSVEMMGQWRCVNGRQVFQIRTRVTNIGASKVSLQQSGTGLRISLPAKDQSDSPDSFRWEPVLTTPTDGQPKQRTFVIFKDHEWIEPGETISEDLLLNLAPTPTTVLLETRLVWSLSAHANDDTDRSKNVVVFARQIVSPESAINDNSSHHLKPSGHLRRDSAGDG